jgi:hypothetical protein
MIRVRSVSIRYLPTEDEIRAECRRIRCAWSVRERESRWVGDREGRKLVEAFHPVSNVEEKLGVS